jgi:hypothetical protein
MSPCAAELVSIQGEGKLAALPETGAAPSPKRASGVILIDVAGARPGAVVVNFLGAAIVQRVDTIYSHDCSLSANKAALASMAIADLVGSSSPLHHLSRLVSLVE